MFSVYNVRQKDTNYGFKLNLSLRKKEETCTIVQQTQHKTSLQDVFSNTNECITEA